MLVLTRKKNEQIIIGDNIVITIVECDNDRVKIGIDAPKDIKIYRNELIEDVKSTNRLSAESDILELKLLEKEFLK